MKSLGLYRTTKVNYVPYTTDGNGRDGYIAADRGGLFPNNSISPDNIRRTGTLLHTKVSYKSVSPYYKTPNFHYHSDGNGRDSYIYTNGGGLIYDSKPLNSFKLTDFLRKNEDDFIISNNNSIMSSNKNKEKYQNILRAKEKDIINRLYENEKKKFLKNKKNESLKVNKTEENEFKLPKIIDKKLNNINKDDETKKIEENKNDLNLNKNNILVNNKSNKTLDYENFMKSISKINNFDEKKRLKKNNNQLFNQAYLHLRNINYNYE